MDGVAYNSHGTRRQGHWSDCDLSCSFAAKRENFMGVGVPHAFWF